MRCHLGSYNREIERKGRQGECMGGKSEDRNEQKMRNVHMGVGLQLLTNKEEEKNK